MMDYTVSPGVNDDQPFTRFLIFGPSGELLPSINLDGRREKFVPGVCVACHGSSEYAGHYPEDGSGRANIGAHFLPYDVGNFAFSDSPGLTRADQEEAIYELNQVLLQSGPTPAAEALIAGWYQNGSTTQDQTYLPESWVGQGYDEAYHEIFAHSCRTCHVNLREQYNFDVFEHTQATALIRTVCSGLDPYDPDDYTTNQVRRYSMPNSLVTFNRFWNTRGTNNDLTQLYADFVNGFWNADYPQCALDH